VQQRITVPDVPKVPPGCDPEAIVLSYSVNYEMDGMRLDRFVQNRIPRLSRTRAQAVVRESAFRQDGRRRRPSDIVRQGEVVLLVRERFVEPAVPTDFQVLHEDATLLVLHKPAGLPVHRTATYHRNTLTYQLRERYGLEAAPHVAHRLDRETSGVLVCVKERAAERTVQQLFEQHQVQKRYLAIVRGRPEPADGVIELPLAPVRDGLHLCMEVREDGAPAQTVYRTRACLPGHTLVALWPRSGRQHQLRVHLSAIGHPIVGDKLYGPEGTAPFLDIIEQGMTPEVLARLGHPRHALHAHGLSLPHPVDGRITRFRAPLPNDLRELWVALGGNRSPRRQPD